MLKAKPNAIDSKYPDVPLIRALDGESCSGIYSLLINGWKMEFEFSNSTYSAQIKSLSKP